MSYSDPMAEIKARAYAESVRQSFAPKKDAVVAFAVPLGRSEHCEGYDYGSLASSIVESVMYGSSLYAAGCIVNGYGGENWGGHDVAIDDDRMAARLESAIDLYRQSKEVKAWERLRALIQDGPKKPVSDV